MKPLHIALLVAAGALGGAVVMKISQRPPRPTPVVARLAQTQTPETTQPAGDPVPLPPGVAVPLPGAAPPAAVPAPPAAEQAGARAAVEPAQRTQTKPVAPARAGSHKSSLKQASLHQAAARKPSAPALAASQPNSPPPAPVVAPAPADSTPAPLTAPPARIEPENATPPPPAPPEPHRVTLNAGTLIPVRLVDGLTAERNLPGDSFTATLDKELVVDGFVIAERGARVEGRVVASDRGGRVKGVSSLQVELVRLHLADGQTIPLQTEGFSRLAEATHNQDAAKVGGGAALGAIIGAIAGGGKGAAIGAGVGGAAGAGDVIATRGKPAALPSETRVTFRLRAPVTITEKLPDRLSEK